MPRILPASALTVAGLFFLAAAGILYSDYSGFSNLILVHEGFLSFQAPWWATPVHSPIRTANLWEEAVNLARIAFALLALLGLLVLIRYRRAAAGVVRRWPRGGQGLLAVLFLSFVLAAFVPPAEGSPALSIYFGLGSAGFVLLLVGLSWRRPPGDRGSRALGPTLVEVTDALSRKPDWILLPALFLAMLTAACLVAIFVFSGVPHVVDGVSHLFQARIFASSKLYLPSHPLREFFNLDTVVNNGRWFSQYPPGHAILLLLGDQIGAPWLVNPVLGALTLPSLYLLGREVYPRSTALLATLLALFSPFLVFMSGEYFNHASAFLFLTLFLLHYLRFSRRGILSNAALAGLFLGLSLLSRPLTALAVAVPCGADALLSLSRAWKLRRAVGLALLSAVTLTFVALLLLYNRETTGAFLSFGYAEAAGPGFGWGHGVSIPLSLDRVRRLNDALLGWPIPCVGLTLFAFLGGPPSRADYLFAGIIVSLLAAYSTVAYNDTEFGPRYLYEASGAVLLLSARGFCRLHEGLHRLTGRSYQDRRVREVGALALVVAFLSAAACAWIPRAGFYGSANWRWAIQDDAVQATRSSGVQNALVFVVNSGQLVGDRRWESTFLQNGLRLDTMDVIFARDLGEKNRELMEFYPGRRYYLADSTGLRSLDPTL